MYQERKKLGFEILISNLFSNLGRLVVANLIFAVPFLGSVAIMWCVYRFLLPVFVLVIPFSLVLASPFYSGVVLLAREYSQNKSPQKVLRTYLKAVKDNGLRFLCYGALLYVAILGCYFGTRVYLAMAASYSGIFYVLLFFVFLITLFFLFFFYAVPLMTVSFELKLKDVLKNSALMTFGEFKNNFFSTIGIVIFLAIALFPLLVIPYLASVISVGIVEILLTAYLAISLGILIPAPCAMIISHYLYPNMKTVISGEGVPTFKPASQSDNTKSETTETTPTPEEIEELSKGDGDEYIFYQGKMIRRKVLLKMLKEKENKNE